MERIINLWATEGYIIMPDGNSIYIWGYADAPDKPAQLPGPRIVVRQGDTVKIILHNALPEATSLIFPGQENVMVNFGAGSRPV